MMTRATWTDVKRKHMRRLAACALALCAFACRAEDGGAQPEPLPEALAKWSDPAYTKRYILKVAPAPKAGAAGLQGEPSIAKIYLPLKTFEPEKPANAAGAAGEAPAPRVEDLLLLGEDGSQQAVFVRPVKNGREVEVAFATRPGHRVYALNAGAPDGTAAAKSAANFRPNRLHVILRGLRAPTTLGDKPGEALESKQVKELERYAIELGRTNVTNIDHPEPPFGQQLPPEIYQRYAAVYEGFLHAPLDGKYGFAIVTPGAAFLDIDGEVVCGSGKYDLARKPFDVTGEVDLRAGVHRVVLRYVQLGEHGGVRLCWRPPGERDFLVVAPQAFPRALPAELVAEQKPDGARVPCVHVERMAQFRVGLHRGSANAREWVQLFVKPVDGKIGGWAAAADPNAASGWMGAPLPPDGGLVWVPAGVDVNIAGRVVRFPPDEDGGKNVADLTGGLSIKSAPLFLHPDETGQIYVETAMEPLPKIVPKPRLESEIPLPLARPLGQYRVAWRLENQQPVSPVITWVIWRDTEWKDAEATPDAAGKRTVRVPVETAKLEHHAKTGFVRLAVQLSIGGVPIETLRFRLLHSRGTWPGAVTPRSDGLSFVPVNPAGFAEEYYSKPGILRPSLAPANASEEGQEAPALPREEVLVVVPREDPAQYRVFNPPGLAPLLKAKNPATVFLGDPLVEAPPEADPARAVGLASRLAKLRPERPWSCRVLPGPHKGRFVFKLLAETEAWLAQRDALAENARAAAALVSVGGGDAQWQTPDHEFERGLDVVIDRLRGSGVRELFFVGVLPEPGRAEQGKLYQERWAEIVRQHRLDAYDLFGEWTKESDWMRRFSLDPENQTPTYGPTPGSESLDELARTINAKL